MKPKTIIVTNSKTRLPFHEWEVDLIKKLIEVQPYSAYSIIKKSAKISRDQTIAFIANKFMEKKPGLRMRDFIKDLKDSPELFLKAS